MNAQAVFKNSGSAERDIEREERELRKLGTCGKPKTRCCLLPNTGPKNLNQPKDFP
jgi:hypothetical protein